MGLTPEDVVGKRFKTTKMREGYDQEEVDEFLDLLVVEFRRRLEEHARLTQELSNLQSVD